MEFLSKRCAFILMLSLAVSAQLYGQERIALLQAPFVVLMDPVDGTIIDPTFIDLGPLSPGTTKAIAQVQDEIWITDQLEDRIDRFDLNGDFLSTISGGLDNIKGLALVNGEVWVTNAGSNNGAPGDAIVRLDTDGNNLGFIDTGGDSSFDVIDVGGEVYISYINAGSRIERRDYDGAVLGNIVETGVVSFIQQMEVNTNNSSVYAAVFSSAGANGPGLYEFAESDGAILNYYDEGALRGVAQLSDGNVLFSGSSGVSILDPITGTSTSISGNSSQYFGRLDLTSCTPPPTPTGDANQLFIDGATLEDIVISPTDVTWFATEADATTGDNPLPIDTLLEDGMTYYAVNIVSGCLSEPFAVTVVIELGVEDFEATTFSIAPNPVNDVLYYTSNTTIEKISIYNLLGQQVLEKKNNSAANAIDLQQLIPGLYVLIADFGSEHKSLKFVKSY